MKNPVLKRRLNPFLLATTVLVLSLLAGLSVMYQGQLSDILSDKKGLQENLKEQRQQVSQLEMEKANLTQELERKDRQLSNLSSESQGLKSEVDSLNSEVETLEEENSRLQNQAVEIEELNESFGTICDLTWENITSYGQRYESECTDWGHDFGE